LVKPAPPRPTQAQLTAAYGRRIPDLIAPRLDVLFCGINPGLYSGATGHHFARPGNRFWRALHGAGFTDVVLAPWEERRLLEVGCGITNLIARSTANAAELEVEEYVAGRRRLERKLRRYAPRRVAIVGIEAYRLAFARPKATAGRQPERLVGAELWVLPNPSGLNAHHQLPELTAAFGALFRSTRRARRSRAASGRRSRAAARAAARASARAGGTPRTAGAARRGPAPRS
jgi:TDG/mug DNA glycosylase family protein